MSESLPMKNDPISMSEKDGTFPSRFHLLKNGALPLKKATNFHLSIFLCIKGLEMPIIFIGAFLLAFCCSI